MVKENKRGIDKMPCITHADIKVIVEEILKGERENNKKEFAVKLAQTLVFGFTGVVLMAFATGVVAFIWKFVIAL